MEASGERREFIRVPFRTETTVRTADRTIWETSTLDLSMNGIQIATGKELPPVGTPCEIEIVLSELGPGAIIEARGTVVRSRPGILAVHFTEIDLDGYDHLRQVILHNAPDPDRAEQELGSHWGIRKPS